MKLELRRAIMHSLICGVIIFASLKMRIVWHLFFLLIFGLIISILSLKYKIPVIRECLKIFEKPRYIKTFPGKGVLFLIAGCLFVLKFFSQEIALASITILAIGDPVSHLVSGNFKEKILKKKSLSGFILSVMLSSITASIFVPFGYALIAAIAAMISEILIIKLGEDPIDDNIIIPAVAGTVLYLLINYI
ncbi:MAG: hypothetical protein QW041_00505 [Candidatus Pacearchaeota archaeon]